MILKTEDFKEACKTILAAIDNKESTLFTETLELKTEGTVLNLNVTNREYYCRVKFGLSSEEQFDAAVNASVFLKLISKLTTDTIEITRESTYIKIKGNGEYKLPIIFNNDEMIELPTIEIANVTNEMEINSDILHSIAIYNSKELQRGVGTQAVQRCYYVDEHGAITFTTGACVNSFFLPKEIKMLLSDKVVKLFKLFNDNTAVSFTMGQDSTLDDKIQTKVKFETDRVSITAKLSEFGLINSVPVAAIRGAATKIYDYSVVINKEVLLEAISRLLLLNDSVYGFMSFTKDHVSIYDYSKDNVETIPFVNSCAALSSYDLILNINNIKLVLDTTDEDYITLSFGDGKMVVFRRNTICDIIPELKLR